MGERRSDPETRDRIDWLQHGWERTAKRLATAMAVLYIAAGVGGFFLWKYGQSVQDARYDAAFNACQDSNDRHDRTIAQLHAEADRIREHASPKKRKALKASVAANIRLIGVLVPVHQDRRGRSTCGAYARRVRAGDAPAPTA